MSLNREIHNFFVGNGFTMSAGSDVAYEKEFHIKGIVFPVIVSKIDDSFVNIPTAKLKYIPEGLPRNLPHISTTGVLCYLDYEEVVFDRYQPISCLQKILFCIERLLVSYCDGEKLSIELGDEFSAYWNGELLAFIGKGSGVMPAYKAVRMTIDGEYKDEIFAANEKLDIARWMAVRSIKQDSLVNQQAVVLETKNTLRVPVDSSWPPKSFSQFFNWLRDIDNSVSQSLLDRMLQSSAGKRFSIIIKSPTAIFGVYVEYNNLLKLRERKGNKSSPHKQIKEMLVSDKKIQSFRRLMVFDVSLEHIIERSAGVSGLKNLKVAQIGCGAIGGYLSVLLAQNGAGTGEGCLHLYDEDILTPDNLGRHYLDLSYVGMTKSEALKRSIEVKNIESRLLIESYGKWSHSSKNFHTYDLIIDATGNHMFSVDLAHHFHRQSSRKPNLLHVWIDAAGLAVRSLFDDHEKKYTCIRCLYTLDGEITEKPGFELVKPTDRDRLPAVNRKCGSSYMPYSADAAITAAGLALRSALSFSNGDVSPRFRHLSLDPLIKLTKHNNHAASKGCPCCQRI